MSPRFALTARPSASESAQPVVTFSHKGAANTACERFQGSTEHILEVVEIQPFSMKALSVPQNVSMGGVQRELATIPGMFWEAPQPHDSSEADDWDGQTLGDLLDEEMPERCRE